MSTALELVALVHCDLSSIVRGRALLAATFDAKRSDRASVGWVPSALGRTPFGPSIKPSPFGSRGDLRLVADPATRATLPTRSDETPWDIALCDMCLPDREPWDYCPRELLRRATSDVAAATGGQPLVSFEQEFTLLPPPHVAPPLSLAALRSVEPFPGRVLAAFQAAGTETEAFIAEAGHGQFEVPVAPTFGVAAADRAVLTREIVRASATSIGRRATFVPMVHPDEPTNGVHVHLTLIDATGKNLFESDDDPSQLSPIGRAFAAGILYHVRTVVAITAPSAISMARLQPGRCSGASVALRDGDREALLRVPPTTAGGSSAGLRIEYRAADATGNPYLTLAALLRAGLDGIAQHRDPDAQHALHPATLSDALDTLSESSAAHEWFPPLLLEVHTAIKRYEAASTADDDDLAATCARYAEVY